jgi:phosphoribosylglycinamide formyltransferase-1
MSKKRIAIFASGNGTNAMNLIRFFEGATHAEVAFVLTNRPDAAVVQKAKAAKVEAIVVSNADVESGAALVEICQNNKIDLIVLAGFLRKIPQPLIAAYPNRIVNIHPALLPKYGGKGMFGDHVHRAVLEAGDEQSGISIHFVNEQFDEGKLIAQFSCPVYKEDTVETLRQRVQELEQQFFADVIHGLVTGQH